MTDYSKLSDGEISVQLAYFLKPKYVAVIHPDNPSGAQLSWNWLNTVVTAGYFPLRNANELFPCLRKNRIGVMPSGKTVWIATSVSGVTAKHKNPLRAAATVFLMMQEAGNA